MICSNPLSWAELEQEKKKPPPEPEKKEEPKETGGKFAGDFT